MNNQKAFEIPYLEEGIELLNKKLDLVTWPDEPHDFGWKYGANLRYMKNLSDYWRNQFDWKSVVERLNKYNHFKSIVNDTETHYMIIEGECSNPKPLVLLHGWPGSFFEFIDLIPFLTNPEKYDSKKKQSYTLIIPSLPGYGFSFTPSKKRYGVEEISELIHLLVTENLGFKNYFLQGGDWGSFISSRISHFYPKSILGLHLNFLAIRRDFKREKAKNPEEEIFAEELKYFLKEETGYQWIQGTKPQTLGYALSDSPIGLAAWLVEKFYTWTDCKGDLDSYLGRDKILSNIMIYLCSGAITSSFWPYYSRMHTPTWPVPGPVEVPVGYIQFPNEIIRPPVSVAETMYKNIVRWDKAEVGGHFAALEQPKLLSESILNFFDEI